MKLYVHYLIYIVLVRLSYLGRVTLTIRQSYYELASHGLHHSNYELLNNAAILGSNWIIIITIIINLGMHRHTTRFQAMCSYSGVRSCLRKERGLEMR